MIFHKTSPSSSQQQVLVQVPSYKPGPSLQGCYRYHTISLNCLLTYFHRSEVLGYLSLNTGLWQSKENRSEALYHWSKVLYPIIFFNESSFGTCVCSEVSQYWAFILIRSPVAFVVLEKLGCSSLKGSWDVNLFPFSMLHTLPSPSPYISWDNHRNSWLKQMILPLYL